MSYEMKSLNGCMKSLHFSFDSVDLSREIEKALKEKQKESNIKGFRQGKAPIKMIQTMYGQEVKNHALYDFVANKFEEALQAENLKVVGRPVFGATKYEEEEKKVSFEATVETFPEFELKPFNHLSFKQEKPGDASEQLKKMIDHYRSAQAELIALEDKGAALAKDHVAIINFAGEGVDIENPDALKAEEFSIEVGSGRLIPGFEDGMIGMKRDEERDLKLAFPKDYHEESLREKEVTFKVKLLEIKEKKLPEWNDELAKEWGFDSVTEFETKQTAAIQKEEERKTKEKLNQDIIEKLVAENAFDIPPSLLAHQKEALKKDVAETLKSQRFDKKMTDDYFAKWDADLTKRAEFQIRSGLILDQLAQKYAIEATEEDFEKKLDEMTSHLEADQKDQERKRLSEIYSTSSSNKSNLMYALREEKTFAKILEEVIVSA